MIKTTNQNIVKWPLKYIDQIGPTSYTITHPSSPHAHPIVFELDMIMRKNKKDKAFEPVYRSNLAEINFDIDNYFWDKTAVENKLWKANMGDGHNTLIETVFPYKNSSTKQPAFSKWKIDIHTLYRGDYWTGREVLWAIQELARKEYEYLVSNNKISIPLDKISIDKRPTVPIKLTDSSFIRCKDDIKSAYSLAFAHILKYGCTWYQSLGFENYELIGKKCEGYLLSFPSLQKAVLRFKSIKALDLINSLQKQHEILKDPVAQWTIPCKDGSMKPATRTQIAKNRKRASDILKDTLFKMKSTYSNSTTLWECLCNMNCIEYATFMNIVYRVSHMDQSQYVTHDTCIDKCWRVVDSRDANNTMKIQMTYLETTHGWNEFWEASVYQRCNLDIEWIRLLQL